MAVSSTTPSDELRWPPVCAEAGLSNGNRGTPIGRGKRTLRGEFGARNGGCQQLLVCVATRWVASLARTRPGALTLALEGREGAASPRQPLRGATCSPEKPAAFPSWLVRPPFAPLRRCR